jgi:Fe-S oxidoreductase
LPGAVVLAGGVKETNPEYAKWTAKERIKEAQDTGSDALVTGCPGCENLLGTALQEISNGMKIHDIVEILAQSIL